MNPSKRQPAFTIVELLVAMALVAVLLVVSGAVFRYSVQAYRAASAMAEIMQKYQAITYRLKTDLVGLQKEGEICVVWVPGTDTTGDNIVDKFERLDRFYFFTAGSFQTYNVWTYQEGGTAKQGVLHGHTARVCYMLAGDGQGKRAADLPPHKRILGRSQHLYTSANVSTDFPNWASFTSEQNNYFEFDTKTAAQWRNEPIWNPKAASQKSDMAERILDVDLFAPFGPQGSERRGIQIAPSVPLNLHLMLAQGVGQFRVQGWFDREKRWLPEIDPNGDGDYRDSDFFLQGNSIRSDKIPGFLYPGKLHELGPGYTEKYGPYDPNNLDAEHFDSIPGLGPALKFTFTLYDSKGVFPEGKTFTYIVYLNP